MPQSSAATTDTCGSGFFGSIILIRSKRRTLWPGRHLFWSKSASVSKLTATCQPTATCRPNSNSHFGIARSGGRSHLAGVRVFLGACIHRLVASDADCRARHRSRRKQAPARCGPARRSRRVVPRRTKAAGRPCFSFTPRSGVCLMHSSGRYSRDASDERSIPHAVSGFETRSFGWDDFFLDLDQVSLGMSPGDDAPC